MIVFTVSDMVGIAMFLIIAIVVALYLAFVFFDSVIRNIIRRIF